MSTPQIFVSAERQPDTGYTTKHIAVTVENGRVVLTPAADPNALNWDEDEYEKFIAAQTAKGDK